MNRKAMRGGRTETGATLYEIANPCRCTEIDEDTGRRLWNPLCGQSVKPDSCPSCGSSGVSATRLNFECDECEWSMRRPKAGAPERIESWDVTSLYPSCLMGDLPVPNGEWLAPETLTALDVESFFFSPEGEAHFWCITCDVEPNPACIYPILSTKRKVSTDDASAKLVFDNHPIRGACSCGASPPCYVPHGPECTRTGCDLRAHGEGTLCAEHTGVASACTPALTVCCPELRIALRNGWRITKVHAALKYKKARYMNEYITAWAAIKNHQDTLKKAKNPAYNLAMRAAAKLILNSIYGRTLMRERETIAELLTAAQRIEKLKDDAARARVLTEQQLDGGAWLVTSHKAWKPASGLPPCIGVFCLSLSKAVLYNGVTRAVAAGATWLGGDTDAVTLALPHGVEFPLELQGSAFGLFTRDYAEQLLTAWSNPFLKGYAFNITHDHAAYLPAAIKELRTVVLAWPAVHTANERQLLDALDSASRLDSSSLSRDVLQQRDVRHALVATLHEDKGAVLINALLDLIGPEVMKMKGARVSDNLGALSYERYSALASGEVQQLTVVKSQLLKLGWCGQRSMAFTHAPIHVRGQNDKRKVLALESPFVELPPGQLPRAGIKRRLTVPWGYDPLPRTVAQVQLCIDAAHELSAVAACVGEALDWSTLKAEQLDQLKVVWARVRSEGGSASVASTRTGVHCGGCAPFGFDVKRRRTCTHAQRDTQWTTLAGGATPCTRRASDGTVDTSATLVEALHSLPIPLRSEEQHKTLSPVNKMAPRKSVAPSKCTAEFIMFMVRAAVTDSKSVPLEPARSSFERQLRRGIRKRTGSKRSTLQKGARLEALCRQLFPDALLSRS